MPRSPFVGEHRRMVEQLLEAEFSGLLGPDDIRRLATVSLSRYEVRCGPSCRSSRSVPPDGRLERRSPRNSGDDDRRGLRDRRASAGSPRSRSGKRASRSSRPRTEAPVRGSAPSARAHRVRPEGRRRQQQVGGSGARRGVGAVTLGLNLEPFGASRSSGSWASSATGSVSARIGSSRRTSSWTTSRRIGAVLGGAGTPAVRAAAPLGAEDRSGEHETPICGDGPAVGFPMSNELDAQLAAAQTSSSPRTHRTHTCGRSGGREAQPRCLS